MNKTNLDNDFDFVEVDEKPNKVNGDTISLDRLFDNEEEVIDAYEDDKIKEKIKQKKITKIQIILIVLLLVLAFLVYFFGYDFFKQFIKID